MKLYRPSRGNPLFANDPVRERQSLRALSGTGFVPRYLAHGRWQGQDWLMYSHLVGAPWREDTAHVARLLGILHDQVAFSGLPDGANGSQALASQTLNILAQCSGPGRDLRRLHPQGVVPPTRQTGLIHGDPVPGNLVEHDGTLALIDWQCPQRGDPAEDLALFLSPAMQFLYRGRPLGPEEEAQFASAYPDRRVVARYFALKPWFHWRMAAYCMWRNDTEALDLEVSELQSIRPSSA
ncbi:phosphotransferase [Phaeobacter sp. B1627]|uniref:phosphotransferase n=1 Tax=Phaeobacter sp. B1627 TaxID=2583809 RepID=UPI003514514C